MTPNASTIELLDPGSQNRSRPDLVLFIAYCYPPSPEVGATRPSHFVKYLRRFGYNVKVVTAFQQTPPREEVVYVPLLARPGDRTSVPGVAEMVVRKFLWQNDDQTLWAVQAARAAGKLVRQHRNTVVFTTFPPLNSHLAGWWLKRKYNVRWVADFRDPLVGSPGRQLTQSGLRFGAISAAADRAIERNIFRDADSVIANTDTVLEAWRQRYPAASGKVTHIWNGFDPEELATAAPIPPRACKVMAHVGSIYTGRHPGPLLRSLDRLTRDGRLDPKRFLLNLVGYIDWNLVSDRELFTRLAELGCLRATGEVVSKAEAVQITREADYLLLLDVIIAGGGQQLPSKIFEYIPIARPILAITTRNSPADRLLARSGISFACIYNDSLPEEADEAVLKITSSSSHPAQPSEWFVKSFDAVHRTRALSELIDSR